MADSAINDHFKPPKRWEGTLFFDGSAQPNPGDGGCGWRLLDHHGDQVYLGYGRVNEGRCVTSDQAEYEGLYNGLVTAYDQGMRTLLIKGDSELVINQMAGKYQLTLECQRQLGNSYAKSQKQLRKFRHSVHELRQISRKNNKVCDGLSKRAVEELGTPVGRRYFS